MRRLSSLLVIALILLPTPAHADGRAVQLGAGEAKAGDTMRVTGSGWPAGQLIQLVTCGEGGLSGSVACDNRAALATPVRPNGTFVVDLQIGDPPRACPCVVHAALVEGRSGQVVNEPLTITGHPVGPLPSSGAPPRVLEVQDARISRGSFASWFGWPDKLTMTYTVRNPTVSTLANATVRARMLQGGDDNVFLQENISDLGPGQSRTFLVTVAIPVAAFGRYGVSADVSGLAEARVHHDAYPWGLFAVNAIGLLLIAWGLLHRYRRRSEPALIDPSQPALPAVVRVGSLGAFLVFDDAPGSGRLRRLAAGQLSTDGLRTLLGTSPGRGGSVVDLDALDRVMRRRYKEER
ncbi:hypothetical protein [Paractinoplanes atraurantiacus]|uniref:Uncharacterized protein n=1 Tax=Paractinoplanes atraurantiacus TaxID=1036182 RepID=A0A285KRH7_9ACTN|nr:hypothetical protein [Actinoplanes atraurantiacus]SNY75254.1 hypothetical protein SAMN05421748_15618 [Actinoplanes atraurantiacus]